jgi:hypothetical protein
MSQSNNAQAGMIPIDGVRRRNNRICTLHAQDETERSVRAIGFPLREAIFKGRPIDQDAAGAASLK